MKYEKVNEMNATKAIDIITASLVLEKIRNSRYVEIDNSGIFLEYDFDDDLLNIVLNDLKYTKKRNLSDLIQEENVELTIDALVLTIYGADKSGKDDLVINLKELVEGKIVDNKVLVNCYIHVLSDDVEEVVKGKVVDNKISIEFQSHTKKGKFIHKEVTLDFS